MKVQIVSYGHKEIKRALHKANNELNKSYSELVKKIAKTAVLRAKELAPKGDHIGDHYYQTINNQLLNKLTQWLYAERKGRAGHEMKGYLGNILEYGRRSYRPMSPRPHMKVAIEYAMDVHEKEITVYFKGKFIAALSEFLS